MKSLVIRLIFTLLFLGNAATVSPLFGQANRAGVTEIEVMDPLTMYSFSSGEGQGFLKRSPVNLPQPIYPGKETGVVGLKFVISPEGTVEKVTRDQNLHTNGNEEMIKAAEIAVQQWIFAPLPEKMAQEEQDVSVLIQYNDPESKILYSIDGKCTIEGLKGRMPIKLEAPKHTSQHEGIVNATLRINSDGEVVWLGNFHGAYDHIKVIPRLGIITHQALSTWRFDPLVADSPEAETDQEIKVTIRYVANKMSN